MNELYSWIGWIVFWGAAVIGLCAAVIATALWCGWELLNYRIVRVDTIGHFEDVKMRIAEAQRWLSSFPEMEYVFKYILWESADVNAMRNVFARVRGVTVYNQSLGTCPKAVLYTCRRDEGHDGPCGTDDIYAAQQDELGTAASPREIPLPPQCPMWVLPAGSDSILACVKRKGHKGSHITAHNSHSEERYQDWWMEHDQAAAGTSWFGRRDV